MSDVREGREVIEVDLTDKQHKELKKAYEALTFEEYLGMATQCGLLLMLLEEKNAELPE